MLATINQIAVYLALAISVALVLSLLYRIYVSKTHMEQDVFLGATVILTICMSIIFIHTMTTSEATSNDQTNYTPPIELCGDHYHLVFPEGTVIGINEDGMSGVKATFMLDLIIDTSSAICDPALFHAICEAYGEVFMFDHYGHDMKQALSIIAERARPFISGASVIGVSIRDQQFVPFWSS